MVAAKKEGPDGRSKRRPGVEEQRGVILNAAVELFAASGTRAISIAQICNAADVSRPTFYRCYEDKEALVAAIYRSAVDAPVQGMLLRARLNDPAELKSGMEQMLDGIFEQAALARLVFIEANDPTSPAAAIVEQGFELAADGLARDLQRLGATVPSRTYLKAVMAAIQWIAFDAIRKGLSPRDRADAKLAAYELIVRALA